MQDDLMETLLTQFEGPRAKWSNPKSCARNCKNESLKAQLENYANSHSIANMWITTLLLVYM